MEYIIINYGDCNNLQTKRIDLMTNNIDEWDSDKIKSYQIDPKTISSFTIGPMTVLEIFYGANFYGQSQFVINDKKDYTTSYKVFDCPKVGNWSVAIGSFKIWTYAHYDSIYGTRYCDKDNECRQNEYCMCQDGKTNGLWCPKSKKRCVNSKYWYNNAPIPINDEDVINVSCLTGQFDNTNISFKDLKTKFRPCMTDKLKVIEGFEVDNYVSKCLLNIFILIILIIGIQLTLSYVCVYQ